MLVLCSFALLATLLVTNGQIPSPTRFPTTSMSYSPDCVDKLDSCWKMPHANCFAPYQEWAKQFCSNRCGYCIGPTTPAPLCMNNIPNCEAYGKSVCTNTDYMAWASENCRAWCRMCTPEENARLDQMNTQPTTLSPENCLDKVDCNQYGPNACSEKFKGWSMDNCPLHCGYCIGLPTPPPICEDKIPNCKAYNPDTCTNANYRGWVEDNCKKFCGLCTDLPVINHNPQVVAFSGNKRIAPAQKRQFQASHHHQGGTHTCMDNATADPHCQTSAPTAALTTAPPNATTNAFPGSDIKPHPKPNPEWDSKPSVTTIDTGSTEKTKLTVSIKTEPASAIPTVVTPSSTFPIVSGGSGTPTVSSWSTVYRSTVIPHHNGSTIKTVLSSKETSFPSTLKFISPSTVKLPSVVTISHANTSRASPSVTTSHTTRHTSSPSSSSSNSTASTSSTVTIPITLSTTHVTSAPVQNTALVSIDKCHDTEENCAMYGLAACTQEVYRPWAMAHCPLFCGFCIPAILPPCKSNKIANCKEFDDGQLCTSEGYISWSHEYCYAYCNYTGCTETTTP